MCSFPQVVVIEGQNASFSAHSFISGVDVLLPPMDMRGV
jgi:hypothetical protein